jgi:hypothetical protein
VRRGPSIFINLQRNHLLLPQHERETDGIAKPGTTNTAFASLMLTLWITTSIRSMTRPEIDVNHRTLDSDRYSPVGPHMISLDGAQLMAGPLKFLILMIS